ncbi:putative NBD/HSP70 family sugar kinase [Salinibacterium sp. CAN_S4]|uniref:ROK family transcriptional regulator n=1 Tax=Salinibacterium sp. CAN_S4 TaxID=2787727 RepID=UPI0018EFF6EF
MNEETDGVGGLPDSAIAVAIEVLVNGPLSRAALAQRLGLSSPTLTRVVKPLLQLGVLVEEGAVRKSGRGQASLPLNVPASKYSFIGIKLTSELIYGVVTDLRANVSQSVSVPVTSFDVDKVLDIVVDLVAELESNSSTPITAIGVTVGGRVEDGEIVVDSPFMRWQNVPFRAMLQERITTPLYLDHDVAGLMRALHWFGPGRDYSNFAVITVGAGIGYGLVIRDEVVPTVGELVAHHPVDPSGPLCPRGHRGCLVAYLEASSIIAAASVAHGRTLDYEEVLLLASQGDPAASRVVKDAARALGMATADVTAMTGVERVILSGEGVQIASVGRSSLEEGLRAYSWDQASHSLPIIKPMSFVEWARGAAVVAIQAAFPRRQLVGDSAAD